VVGEFEAADAIPEGAGERPPYVAEEFRSRRASFGTDCAIDADQRPVPAIARPRGIAWATNSLPVPVPP